MQWISTPQLENMFPSTGDIEKLLSIAFMQLQVDFVGLFRCVIFALKYPER